MIDERIADQAALYAIDALEGEEKRLFEAEHLRNEEVWRLVNELREAAASLAHAAPPRVPPAALEQKILDAIRSPASQEKSTARLVTWLPWAIAACLAIACAVVFSQRQRLADELAAAQQQVNAAQSETAAAERKARAAQAQVAAIRADKEKAEQQLVELRQREADARAQMATLAAARDEAADKLAQLEGRQERAEREARAERSPNEDRQEGDPLSNIRLATLTSKMRQAPNATAAVVWDAERQRGVLNSANIPANSADRDYQLWIVDSRFADPVSAGVFHVEKSGSTRHVFTPTIRIESPVAFAVSVERRGGVTKAEGPIVLAGN